MYVKLFRFVCILIVLLLVSCQGQMATPGVTPQPLATDRSATLLAEDTATDTFTVEVPDELTATPVDVPPVAEGLQGLDIDAFFEASYTRLVLRCPQCVTALGKSQALGMRDDQLNDMSDAFIRETQALEKAILALLKTYDRDALTPEQRLSYDVYAWYLEDQIRGHAFMYYDYLIRPGVIGYQDDLVQCFTDIHPVTNRQNAEDYVTRLSLVEVQMKQVVDGLERREKEGVMLPRFVLQWMEYSIRSMADSEADATPFYTEFEEKLEALDTIAEADKQDLLQAAEKAIKSSVLPGFDALTDLVEKLSLIHI